jgi:hypothetical protein
MTKRRNNVDIELGIRNFPNQQRIFDSQVKHMVVSKGRRFGLTKGAANDFIKSALMGKFRRGLWIDTVNANIERYVERYFLPHLKKLPENIWHWRKQEKILEIRNAYIDMRSADRPENIEGFGYDKYFINEAGIVLKDEYLWNNAIRPMLWDYKDTHGVIGGTPKGKGVFFEMSERGKDPTQPDYEFLTFTTFDNPFIDVKSIREEIDSMPERVVKQEIYAEFLDDTGVVFRGITGVLTAKPSEPKNGHLYVVGVDLAKVQDFTVISVFDRTDNQQVYFKRINQIEWPLQKKYIIDITEHYNKALTMLDATGIGDPIADDLLRAGVAVEPIKLTNESKKEIIEKLVIWIEQKKLKLLNLEEQLRELTNFTYDISSSGKIMYSAPAGFHDDIVIADALAVWSLQPLIKEPEKEPPSIIHEAYLRQKRGEYEIPDIEDQWDNF